MLRPQSIYVASGLALGLSSTMAAMPITKAEKGLDLNIEYRVSAQYDDHGLEKAAGAESPKPTFALDMNFVNLNLNGNLSKNINYSLSYQLLQSNIDWFFVERKFGALFAVRAGIDRLNIAGFDHQKAVYNQFSPSAFLGHLPLKTRAPAIEATVKMGPSHASLQVTDDVVSTGNAGRNSLRFNETNRQPTVLVELGADFYGLKPLLQFAEYDFRHSTHTAFGVAFALGAFDGYFDYIVDKRAFRSEAVATGELSDEHISTVVQLSYELRDFIPFAKFSDYEVKQGGVDVKGNEFDADAYGFADNGQFLSIGMTIRHQIESLESYFYVESVTSDYTTESNTAVQSKSSLKYVAGLMGSI